MKKIIILLLFIMATNLFVYTNALGTDITITVNGIKIATPDAKPYIDPTASRVKVPVRFISEELGATVIWNSANRTVNIYYQNKTIVLNVDSFNATVNGELITLDSKAVIRNNRTFVPLRFVSEALGAQVNWNGNNRQVSILKSDKLPDKELRGLWVATVLRLDYPQQATTDPEILKNEALDILNKAQEMNLNAVFLQIRPASDAIYKSQYYPWSKYLTGSQELAPDNNFDPLEFWIAEAHKRDIELHGWINPYRITRKSASEPAHDFDSLAPSHPAILNPDWVVKHTDGNLYFNPGLPEVRKLIIDSSLEVINNYDIDGIHFDDYFYPGTSFDDHATFNQYGKMFNNIDDWRRYNVDTLVQDLGQAIKNVDSSVSFGISPFGIWANKSSNALGSDTNGLQSYYSHYADTRKWVKENYIDYIAPQLYWYIGYSIADYSTLLTWWADVVSGTDVDLYIGQAAYRVGNDDINSPWHGVAEIERQIKLNSQTPEVKGSIFFNKTAFDRNPELVELLKGIYKDRD